MPFYPNIKGLVNDLVEKAIRLAFDRIYNLEARLAAVETPKVSIGSQVESYLRSTSGTSLIGALAQPLIGGTADSQLATVGTGNGTVTSITLAVPGQFAVTGPITTSGTITVSWNNQSANAILAGPSGGGAAAPTFRALVAADLPTAAVQSTASKVTAAAPYTNDGYVVATVNGVSLKLMTTA